MDKDWRSRLRYAAAFLLLSGGTISLSYQDLVITIGQSR